MRPALRYHGAKYRLAPWIISHLPPHECYVEPFGGAAGVLLRKKPCYAEVYNDLDGDVVNFFRVLRDPGTRARLIEACLLTPFARDEFMAAFEHAGDPVENARRLCIRATMGFGSAGATKSTTGFRCDSRRRGGTASHLWASYPENLAYTAARFSGVIVENRPAIEVMAQHDSPQTLHYVDPPYLHDTRSTRGAAPRAIYRHEMTEAQHVELLSFLRGLKGKVAVSGYPSPLYDGALQGWARREVKAMAAGTAGSVERTEVLWLNPAAMAEDRGFLAMPETRRRAVFIGDDEP